MLDELTKYQKVFRHKHGFIIIEHWHTGDPDVRIHVYDGKPNAETVANQRGYQAICGNQLKHLILDLQRGDSREFLRLVGCDIERGEGIRITQWLESNAAWQAYEKGDTEVFTRYERRQRESTKAHQTIVDELSRQYAQWIASQL